MVSILVLLRMKFWLILSYVSHQIEINTVV